MSVTLLMNTLQEAASKAAACDAVATERQNQATVLEKKVASAKYRLGLQPEVDAYMVALQHRVHARGVGLYEELLTALIEDVIPENGEPITLELDTAGGLPALTIQLGRGDKAQDIYEDTGGSLTNVVSSGLRFVALARSPLRRFMVLDEPDCWVEPDRIPRFADILSEMSNKVGVQAVLISHHQESAFLSLPDRIRLVKDQGVIRTIATRKPVWENDQQPGIRWIRLQNFMSHADTLLELGPGINVLSGANHIGKSAVANALRAFCYQQSHDRQIMHGHDKFVISIGLENNQTMTYTRTRKGARKTVYSYTAPGMDSPRVEPAEKNKPPDFVLQKLNIQRINDLDIQLSHQKMPVFLLNEPKTKQASLLSAGMESDHVRFMQREYKTLLDSDRALVRQGEKEYGQLQKFNEQWKGLLSIWAVSGLKARSEELLAQGRAVHAHQERLRTLQELHARWMFSQKAQEVIADAVVPPKEPVVHSPEYHQQAARMAATWAQVLPRAGFRWGSAYPESVPQAMDLRAAEALRRNWSQLQQVQAAGMKSIASLPDVLAETPAQKLDPAWLRVYKEWLDTTRRASDQQQQLLAASNALKDAQLQLSAAWGDVQQCPLCEQPLSIHSEVHHAHA